MPSQPHLQSLIYFFPLIHTPLVKNVQTSWLDSDTFFKKHRQVQCCASTVGMGITFNNVDNGQDVKWGCNPV